MPLPLLLAVAVQAGAFVVGVSSAHSATIGWHVEGVSRPSVFSTGDAVTCKAENKCDRYELLVLNSGRGPSSGLVTLTDTLPSQLEFVEAESGNGMGEFGFVEKWHCSASGGSGHTVVSCELLREKEEHLVPMEVPAGSYAPALTLVVSSPSATVQAESEEKERAGGGALMLVNKVEVTGGGATGVASAIDETPVGSDTPAFGVSEFTFEPDQEGASAALAAGGHPWSLTTNFGVPTVIAPRGTANGHLGSAESLYQPAENIKNVIVELPLGFLGNPPALGAPKEAQCTQTELKNEPFVSGEKCPPMSRVGVLAVSGGELVAPSFQFTERESSSNASAVYNMVPETGYPAEFGFTYAEQAVYLYASVVHTPAGYRLRVDVPGVTSFLELESSSLTLFGEPGALNGGGSTAAFLSNPTDCTTEPLKARIEIESWNNPGHTASRETTAYPSLTNCNLLQLGGASGASLSFEPSSAAAGGTSQADEPSGFTTNLKIPQSSGFTEAGTPPLKSATVTLPMGVSINPAAGQGLVGCQAEGPEGINIGSGDIGFGGQDLGDPEATELGAGHGGGDGSIYDDGLYHVAHGRCPTASMVGTAEVVTPLLVTPLRGHVYAAAPRCGGSGESPCTEASATNGELFGAYLEVEGSGVIVKLPGKLAADPRTGQLTASFKEDPQFPFSELKLQLHGGPRAVFATPQTCGQASTTSVLEPWGAPEAPNALTSSSFMVTGCGAAMRFAPTFVAGSTDPAAGAFSPFTLSFSRQDGEQDLSELTETMPAGLLAKVADIPLCGEARASSGTCGAESQIGTVTVSAGAGSQPLFETGRIYLTTPYKGGSFGVAVVTPAVAGPFNLGNVVVRGSIAINPNTVQVTVKSDPFPTILDGVPLRLKLVDATLDREAFTFNPTSCAQQQVTASIAAEQGAVAKVASPFAVSGCQGLPFHPSFSASTEGHTSRVDGASLTVRVAQKAGEANIRKVDLQLPVALSAQLKTLQKACTEAQFNANPAGCPDASIIGSATAVTPTLKAPLTGPAYLVSHGSAAYPDVEFVLQADERGGNVEIVLDGGTAIKKGIVYSSFESVPDAPISSFETFLPEGPHAALTANGKNLCTTGGKTVSVRNRVAVRVHGRVKHVTKIVRKTVTTPRSLLMPTTIVGQNGAVLEQSTPIVVTGCFKQPKQPPRKKLIGHRKHTMRTRVRISNQ